MKIPKLSRNQAITLTELVVASAVVGIAMLGVVAVDYAMRSANSSANIHFKNTTEVGTVMTQIKNAATQTMGKRYASEANRSFAEGIFVLDDASTKTICFRTSAGTDTALFTSDDQWQCFQQDLTAACIPLNRSCWKLWACPPITDLTPPAETYCTTSDENLVLQLSKAGFFTVKRKDNNPNERIEYIEFSISYQPQIDLIADPINNPQYTLTTRVYPPALTQ